MASLKAQIQKAVASAFDAFDDIPVPVTYYQRTLTPAAQQNAYDPATGTIISETPAAGAAGTNTQPYPIAKVFFVRFRQWEIDRDPVKATDMKMIFQTQKLPVTPDAQDFLVDAQGRKWEVVRLMSEPSQSVTTVQVRTAGKAS